MASRTKKKCNPPPMIGDMRVSWFPQIPCPRFTVPVTSAADGKRIMGILADYDKFQFDINVKPDYSNAGVIEVYVEDGDGDGNPDWNDWIDEDESP